jgi:hypothetical protein
MNFRDCITMPIVPFLGASGISRTRFYELVAADEIKSVTVGKRRLVIIQSYLDFLDRQTHAPPIPSPNPRAALRVSKALEEHSRVLTDDAVVKRQAPKIARNEPRRRGRPAGSKNRAREVTPATPAARPR